LRYRIGCRNKPATVTDAKTIRFVTANYAQLQGLRLVPLGMFLMLCAWADLAGLFDRAEHPHGIPAEILTRVGLAGLLAFLLVLAAPIYYHSRYGSIEPRDRRERNRWIAATVIGFFMLAKVDRQLQWPVSLQLLLVSVALFVTVWHDGWIRRHYLVPALAWLVASRLPALDISRMDVLLGLGGLTLIVCGLGDHLLLTRTLAAPRIDDDGSCSATI
jgi:hypothetical protein